MAAPDSDPTWLNLGVALAIGFLIGIEREGSKGTGPQRAVAGLRTFTLISLAGALSLWIGGVYVFIATGGTSIPHFPTRISPRLPMPTCRRSTTCSWTRISP